MSFWELMTIRTFTVDARDRIIDLYHKGLIEKQDMIDTCNRFHDTYESVRDFMLQHDM